MEQQANYSPDTSIIEASQLTQQLEGSIFELVEKKNDLELQLNFSLNALKFDSENSQLKESVSNLQSSINTIQKQIEKAQLSKDLTTGYYSENLSTENISDIKDFGKRGDSKLMDINGEKVLLAHGQIIDSIHHIQLSPEMFRGYRQYLEESVVKLGHDKDYVEQLLPRSRNLQVDTNLFLKYLANTSQVDKQVTLFSCYSSDNNVKQIIPSTQGLVRVRTISNTNSVQAVGLVQGTDGKDKLMAGAVLA